MKRKIPKNKVNSIIEEYLSGETSLSDIAKRENVCRYRLDQILDKRGISRKRKCTCCGKNRRLINSFHKNKNKKHGREYQCKECYNKKKKVKRLKDKPEPTHKKCRDCKETFLISEENFYKDKRNVYTPRCRTCHKKYADNVVKNNKERHKQYVLNYSRKCRDEMNDLYICTLLRARHGSKINIYSHERDKYMELIEKERTKLKLEREIQKEIKS